MKDMVMVRQPVLPVYAAPSETAERSDELLYGMWGQLTGEERDGFVRICTGYGYEGWCRRDGLKFGEWDVCRTWCSSRAFVQSRFLDILREPSVRAQVMITLPRGSLITVCEETERDGWLEVELLGRMRGYVRSGQVSRIRTGKRDCYWRFSSLTVTAPEEERLRKSLVDTAMSYLGTPYRWGGKSTWGIDCSGLCSLVYWIHGIVICRDSRLPAEYAVREIAAEAMRPGDLLYFPGHMAMYIGGRKYIHSSFSRLGVIVSSMDRDSADYFPELEGKLQCVGSVFLPGASLKI